MKTQIFESYVDFLKREDKNINGVNEDFAAKHPDFEEGNKTNTACWNCSNCVNCYACEYCDSCDYLYACQLCKSCKNCSACYSCESCEYCESCISCDSRTSLYGHSSSKNREI